MYLIYGLEEYFIEKKVKNLLDNNDNVFIFDENSKLKSFIESAENGNLFADNKILVWQKCPFLKKSSPKEEETFLTFLKENINNKNVEIVLTYNEDLKMTSPNKVMKFINEYFTISKADKLSQKDLAKFIKETVENKNGLISLTTAINLATKLPNNLHIVVNEIDKLLLSSFDGKITQELIEQVVEQYVDDEPFAFINALISLDYSEIMKEYNQKINEGVEPITLLNQISQFLILSNKINLFKNMNMDNQQISSEIKVHNYRVRLSKKFVAIIGETKLQQLIGDLVDVDKDIKKGIMDPDIAIRLFLIKLIK